MYFFFVPYQVNGRQREFNLKKEANFLTTEIPLTIAGRYFLMLKKKLRIEN